MGSYENKPVMDQFINIMSPIRDSTEATKLYHTQKGCRNWRQPGKSTLIATNISGADVEGNSSFLCHNLC